MRLWPAMFGVRIVRTVSSFSLLLLLVGLCSATDYAQLKRDLDGAKTPVQVNEVLSKVHARDEDDLGDAIANVLDATDAKERAESLAALKQMLEVRLIASAPLPGPAVKQQAHAIKSSPLYRDTGDGESSNWLSAAIRRLLALIPKFTTPRINAPSAGFFPGWLIPMMWGLLGAAVLIFGYFAIRAFTWKRNARRKAKAVLEEDEPDRSLDEWLALADKLTSEGKYREAVRALYLSCLLKFDEHNVARFVRGETNWEHLARIQRSAKKPPEVDFLPPTQAFDRVWYGMHVRGAEDVQEFRGWYGQITEALAGVRK